jgi:Schlafen, AlbA_2
VLSAEEANLFSESLTFEVKEKRDKSNVAEAVAALSNTDGGVILVGVKDKDATGEDRIAGVPKSEHDAVASNLHALIPEAMPEIIPVAIPGGDGFDARRPSFYVNRVYYRVGGFLVAHAVSFPVRAR